MVYSLGMTSTQNTPALTVDYSIVGRSQWVAVPGSLRNTQTQAQTRFGATVRREAKKLGLRAHVCILGGQTSATVLLLKVSA
jgi:hypothetical protein